jgi:hypothetical protein
MGRWAQQRRRGGGPRNGPPVGPPVHLADAIAAGISTVRIIFSAPATIIDPAQFVATSIFPGEGISASPVSGSAPDTDWDLILPGFVTSGDDFDVNSVDFCTPPLVSTISAGVFS